jgi:transcription antitermination factor NusG
MSEADWYVLAVVPGHELDVIARVRALELMARIPIETRTLRSRGRHNQPVVREVKASLLPGYVFMGSKRGVDWPTVQALKGVHGVLMSDGRPGRLSEADVAAVDRLCKEDHRGGTLQVGAVGRILRGPFRELEAVIQAIRPDLVRVSVHVFGAEREISVNVDNIASV